MDELVDAQWVDNGPPWLALRLRSRAAVLAVRPDLPQLDARFPPDREPRPLAISGQIHGVSVRYPGIWEASDGVSDAADQASAEHGEQIVAAISRATADRYWAYAKVWLYCAISGENRPPGD